MAWGVYYDDSSTTTGNSTDTSNPFLNTTNVVETNTDGCAVGSIKSDTTGQCITRAKYCEEKDGVGSVWNGTYCNCGDGFTWNSEKTKCLTFEQYCKEKNGKFGSYNKADNSCGCTSGYIYSSKSNKCISLSATCAEDYPNTK